jgi:hypothetical protein
MLNPGLLIVVALVTAPVDPTSDKVRQLYEHATYNVDVDPAVARQMLREIEQSLGAPSDAARKPLQALQAELKQADPDPRAIRDHARDLYWVLEPEPTPSFGDTE